MTTDNQILLVSNTKIAGQQNFSPVLKGVDIFINQDFYLPQFPKSALVKSDQRIDNAEFMLVDTTNNQTVISGKINYIREYKPWGKGYYYRADFSSLKKEGRYKLVIKWGSKFKESLPIYISTKRLEKALNDAVKFFTIQRCGTVVPGWHDADHLDDAGGKAVGGWHDAGDYNKYIYTQYMPVYALLKLYALTKDEKYLREARWGNDFLLKMVKKDGSLWSAVVATQYEEANPDGSYPINWAFVKAEEETNNEKGTIDDRKLSENQWGDDRWAEAWGSATFAMMAFFSSGNERAKNLKAAKITNSYIRKHFGEKDITNGEQFQGLGGMVISDIYLYKLTGDNTYLNDAKQKLEIILTHQDKAKGFFKARKEDKEPFFADYNYYMFVEAMYTFIQQFPQDPLSQKLKAAIVTLLDKHIASLSSKNPFGQQQWRDDFDKLKPDGLNTVNFYPAQPYMQGTMRGQNSYYLATADVALIGYQLTGNPKYKKIAADQINLVFGLNPYSLTFMESHGTNNPKYWHTRYAMYEGHKTGEIPGAIANGIGSRKGDLPFYDTKPYPVINISKAPAWQTNEPWLPQNAWFVLVAEKIKSTK